jgi:hypothetical protein
MQYSVVPKINIFNLGIGRKIGQYIYFQDSDALYFEAPYPFPVQLLISHGLSKCQVTPMFLKLPFILKGWINLDILLRLIDVMKFVLQGQLMLHASCVDDTLIVGFPNAGKTYQTMKMMQSAGTLISEEYTLIYEGAARPYKRFTRTCISNKTVKDCNFPLTLKQKIHLLFTTIRAKLMPFMFEAVIWTNLKTCGKTAKVKRILYGSTGREISNWKDLAILTENEFPFMSSDFLQAYALATGFDMIDVQNRQRKLIKEFCETVYPATKPQ